MRIIVLILSILLFACEEPITDGQIIAKEYEEPRTWIMLVPIITSCGTNCRMTMMIPYVHYDDEDFIVIIQGWHERLEEFQTRRMYLHSRQEWERLNVGDWFPETVNAEPYDIVERRPE